MQIRLLLARMTATTRNSSRSAWSPFIRIVRRHRRVDRSTHIVRQQGAEIDRPSTVYIEMDSEGEKITAVRVSGQVVLVTEGVVRF
jgi:predicted PhzF superfamily epimerase YddE/YHI9